MIELAITKHEHLRFGSGKPKFRKKIHDWLETNVGIHGIDWHLHRRMNLTQSPTQPTMGIYYVINCSPNAAMMFKLTWL